MKCARIKLALLVNDSNILCVFQQSGLLIVHNKEDFCVEVKIQNTWAKLSYKIELEKNSYHM